MRNLCKSIIISFLFLISSHASEYSEKCQLQDYIVKNIECFTLQELKQAQYLIIFKKLGNDQLAQELYNNIQKINSNIAQKKQNFRNEYDSSSLEQLNKQKEILQLLEADLIKAKTKFKDYLQEHNINL